MEVTRIMHILNIDGNGKEAFFVNGMTPKDEAIKRLAQTKIIDYEFIAAGKPSAWCGRLNDAYYASGFLTIQGRHLSYSYCSFEPSEQAHQNLLTDIKALGFSLDDYDIPKEQAAIKSSQKKIIGICIAFLIIAGIIIALLCK